MASLTRGFVVIAVGGTPLAGLPHGVVAPATVASGYGVSPPVVVIRPYRHDHPYRDHHPDHPDDGGYPSPYRW